MSTKTLSGLLTINKPEGMTSRQTVTRVSNVLRQAGYGRQIRVGHCGTLDPLATGLVVICVGRSTRLVQLIQERPKSYIGTFQLGCDERGFFRPSPGNATEAEDLTSAEPALD